MRPHRLRAYSALSVMLLALSPAAPAAAASQQGGSDVERLERQVRACDQALERRRGTAELAHRQQRLEEANERWRRAYGELARLRADLDDLRAAEAAATSALDSWSRENAEGTTLDEATARVTEAIKARWMKEEELRLAEEEKDRANLEQEDEELKLSQLRTRIAEQSRDAASIEAECDRLRGRLAAARAAAGPSPSPTPAAAAAAGWGLDEGASWTEAVPTATPAATPAAGDWWHEEGATGGGSDRPGSTPRRTPAVRTPPPANPSRAPNRTRLDVGAGPYHEFAALCRLGWAAVLAEYSVGPADTTIAEHLRMAGEHMRAANATTFDPLRAWPDWAGRKGRYDALAAALPGASASFRRQLAQELDTGWTGPVNDLAWQLAGELQKRENCDSHYARLGFTLCSGQQSLQIAAAARREGDRDLEQRAADEGRRRLDMARRELESLPTVRLASGRCVDLGTVLARLASWRRGDLEAEVEAADGAFAEAIRVLAGAAGAGQQPLTLGTVAASGWTWGANLNVDVLFTPAEPFAVTGVKRCLADWSNTPQACQAESRERTVDGRSRTFCCTGFWLTGRIAVPGQGTFVVQWPDTGQNRLRIPAGATVNLGSLYMLAAGRGDFENDAVYALVKGLDGSGRAVEIESPVFTAGSHFASYEQMCGQVGSAMTP